MSEDNLNSNPSPYQSILNQYSSSKNLPDAPPPPVSPTITPTPPSPETQDPQDQLPPADALPLVVSTPLDVEVPAPNGNEDLSNGAKNPFKNIFFISLFIFLVILGSIILSFYQQSQTFDQTIRPTPTPFKTTQSSPSPAKFSCLLNDKHYQIGESFPSADDCNTCTCLPDLIISCTNTDCGQ